ncbi:MAG: helix-turn-helix domain-containing protein [Haloechinothrix sp.]
MNGDLARLVGERVRFYRTTVHKTKTVVAGLTGNTPDYLYQIERGQKLPTIAVLAQLSEVLGAEPGDLLAPGPAAARHRTTGTAADALTGPQLRRTEPLPLSDVHNEVLKAWQTWQTSPQRYSILTAELPGLIADTETILRGTVQRDRRAAQACAADLYGLLRTVTKRIGRVDLSLVAADRAVRAAEAADDPVRLAGAHWNLTQVLLADGQPDGAEDVAMHAVEDLGTAGGSNR